MKILLLGGRGQVGWELQRALAPLGAVTALDTRSTPAADFDRPDALPGLLDALAPDLIVNAAAHTAVDRAESEPERVQRINAEAPGELARWAAARGAWLVHYSSDYVFDGRGDRRHDEADATGPLSVYGRSKLEAERCIAASGCLHLILRTSWVYAARGDNFARTMLRLAAERDTLRVVDDQIGAPTGAELLADVTAHALRRARAQPALAGLYHCVAGGQTSWHGYACHVIEWARARGLPVKVAADAIVPVPSSDYPTAARRPLNSRLATDKLQAAFDLVLPPWQAGVERMLQEIHH